MPPSSVLVRSSSDSLFRFKKLMTTNKRNQKEVFKNRTKSSKGFQSPKNRICNKVWAIYGRTFVIEEHLSCDGICHMIQSISHFSIFCSRPQSLDKPKFECFQILFETQISAISIHRMHSNLGLSCNRGFGEKIEKFESKMH